MAQRWIVTATGRDQPGIVAAVTEVLYRLGANLEDSAMTRLEGEFAIMLIFSSPHRQTEEALRRAFAPVERRLALAVHLKPLTTSETTTPRRRRRAFLISVYGADRPGIVFHITRELATAGVNITDVHTRRSAGSAPSLYLLLLEVEAPPGRSLQKLEGRLRRIAGRLGVEISLRPVETEVL
jgi:glycine cleavage system transcriptional repressor